MIFAGAVAGLSLGVFEDTARAENDWRPIVMKVQASDPNDLARVNSEGRLRKTDEEFTNEQAVVHFFGNGSRGLFVEMRTGALSTGETPVHRMQASCTPIELTQDPTTGAVAIERRAGERFITDNDGNEYRNANKPELMPINNGKNMLVMFNYQPNNDTRRYVKVLDESCNEIPIRNANGELRKQVLVMAKNNDDCDMHQTGEGPCDIQTDAGGVTNLVCWAGCNGNGEDDGWLNHITVDCDVGADGLATECTIRKNFDLSLAQREERSRGRCTVADEDVNTAICTWTEGNNQPQRDGTWIAAVDISPDGEQGEDADSRLIWKEMIDDDKQTSEYRTYSVRAMSTRIMKPRPDGTLERTNMLFIRTGDLQGQNRDDRKGGTYRAFQMGVLKATREGMEWVMPLRDTTNMLLGIDGTHLTMCGAVFGEDSLMPGFTLLQGSHNGGGVTEPISKAIAWDEATNKFIDLGTHRVGGSYDRHLYSNYLGNNPGNQGRNFAGCQMIKNPFAGQNGNLQQYFIAHALTGKDPAEIDRAELKPSSYLTLLPVATMKAPVVPEEPPPTTEEPPPTGNTGSQTGGTPANPTSPPSDPPSTDEPPQAAPSMLGCSAAPGSNGSLAALFIAGIAVLGVIVSRKRGRR